MNTKQVIRLSLLSSLLVVLNGCGDSSSNKQEERPSTQNEQEVVGFTGETYQVAIYLVHRR